MFERFTDRARRVVVLAQDEAKAFNHNYIGTEHILLGLIRDEKGVAAVALGHAGITLKRARELVIDITPKGEPPTIGRFPFSPRAKKVLELALRVALELGHNYISTEHILLGLIREGEGVGAQAIVSAGVSLESVAQMTHAVLFGDDKALTILMPPILDPDIVSFGRGDGFGAVRLPEGAEVTRMSVTIRLPGSKRKHRHEVNWEDKDAPS